MEITRDEFYRALDGLKLDLKEDLAGIRRQQEIANGRTGKLEIDAENHRTRLQSLEKTVFSRRQADKAGEAEEVAASATWKNQGALIGVGLSVIVFLIEILEAVGRKLWELLTHHV